MAHSIGQRELRNYNAKIMRRVEAGEMFIVTRNGKPVADLVPHRAQEEPRRNRTLGEIQEAFRGLPPMDSAEWHREREADDAVFGPDGLGEPGEER